jgi:hypothetical protein
MASACGLAVRFRPWQHGSYEVTEHHQAVPKVDVSHRAYRQLARRSRQAVFEEVTATVSPGYVRAR